MKNKKTSWLIPLLLVIILVGAFFLFSNKSEEVETPENNNSNNNNSTEVTDINTEPEKEYVDYYFRSKKLLNQHYDKHGKEMGFASSKEYEKAASDVANNPNALYKKEKEDNDDVYYLEETNEFVIISTDGYIRTYFKPDAGKAYFDRQ